LTIAWVYTCSCTKLRKSRGAFARRLTARSVKPCDLPGYVRVTRSHSCHLWRSWSGAAILPDALVAAAILCCNSCSCCCSSRTCALHDDCLDVRSRLSRARERQSGTHALSLELDLQVEPQPVEVNDPRSTHWQTQVVPHLRVRNACVPGQ